MLSAVEAGYGGCMIGSFDSEFAALADIPSHIVPKLVIALGKPAERVVLTEAEGENVKYYRDFNNVHYTPKRKLEDIVI